jgi:activating signal cointegrator complex subunit 3
MMSNKQMIESNIN